MLLNLAEDIQLMQEWQNGAHKAYETLFLKYYSSLCKFAYIFVESVTVSEEIVSDVLFELWLKRNELTITVSLKAYLFTAVKNKCYNYLKKASIKTIPFEENSNSIHGSDSADQSIIFEQTSTHIDNNINRLPEQCKVVFLLSRDEGMSYKEIAQVLNISAKTVETQIYRALKALKKSLKNA